MYEYKVERVELKGRGKKVKDEYQEIINDYAKKGWRFVQIFAPGIGQYGSAVYYEIIFEKEID